MKRVLIILTAFLMASCVRIRQKAVVVPSATPEMLIVRPTRELKTQEVAPIVLTLTAWPKPTATPWPTSTLIPEARLGSVSSGYCLVIIGNVNKSTGTKIYHCSNWRDYNKIEMNEAEGDRFFCSEAEARAAGFREPDYSHGPCR